MMVRMLRGVLMVLVLTSAAAGQGEFPFGQELILEERPLPGSKQRPILNVSANGAAEIDLWCRAGIGRVSVSGSTVTVLLGAFPERPCGPERMQGDEQLAADLAQVTAWRREGEDIIVLIGARDLRFRQSAH